VEQRTRSWLGLAGWLAICFAAGRFGSLFQPGAWFDQLAKPSWQPPNWLFGPVWTVLYILMAVAAWLVWKEYGFRGAPLALGLFLLKLVLNAMWSWLFFGLQRPDLAFVEVIVFLAVLAATVVLFWRRRPLAGALMLPYLAWVAFATVLTGTIWWLN
jgi:translocator protein